MLMIETKIVNQASIKLCRGPGTFIEGGIAVRGAGCWA